MKRWLWTMGLLACGLALTVRAGDEDAPAVARDEGRKDASPEAAVDRPTPVHRDEGGKERSPEARAERPKLVEAVVTGKLTAQVFKTDDGSDVTIYVIETADGARIGLSRREGGLEGGLPEGVDLAALAGKTVTVRAQVIERKRGDRTMKQILKVLAIEAAAE